MRPAMFRLSDTAAGKYVQGYIDSSSCFRRKGSFTIRLPVRSICLHCRAVLEKDLHSLRDTERGGRVLLPARDIARMPPKRWRYVSAQARDAQMFQKLGYAYQADR